MAYYIAVGGNTLYQISTAGVLTTLTLPNGVSVDTTRKARMAVLGRNVVIVNGLNRSVFVDPLGVVRPLILRPPVSPPKIAAGAAGALSGTFNAWYTNAIKDPDTGAILAESAFSPISQSLTIAAQLIAATGVQVSPDTSVNTRRLYRTVTGGSAKFNWIDLDSNVATALADDTSDAALGLFAAPTELGTAPGMSPGTYMTLIASWKNRLWGVGNVDIDTLRYSGDGLIYGWPGSVPVAPLGGDEFGITGLIPRRDELGIAKRDILWKVIGSSTANFSLVKVIEGKGCWAPDSIVIVRDIAYFLGEDGVYAWGPNGVDCVSDEKVRGWFATDTYFNRSKFATAFAKYNARYHTYELHLAAAGSSTFDRWVSYDITRKEWFGPHKTAAFTPSWGSRMVDSNSFNIPVIGGSNGFLYTQNQTAFNDDGSAITLSLIGKSHSGDAPDIEKVWGDFSLLSAAQAAAGSLQIGAAPGAIAAAVAKTYTADSRLGRERFPIIGNGRNCRLEFTEATLNQGAELYGYELPFGALGRR